MNHDKSIKMFELSLKALITGWRARPSAMVFYLLGGFLEIVSFMLTIYATAQLSGLIAKYASGSLTDTSQMWLWLWIDVAAALIASFGFWIMSWMKRMIYFQVTQWAANKYHSALARIDFKDFYDEKIRNQINKVNSGYTWQISNLVESLLDLIYSVVRFTVTAIIVARIAWWLIIVVAICLLPTLLTERMLAKVQWFVWDDEGDTRQTFWNLTWLIRTPKNQLELRSSQAGNKIVDMLDDANKKFYNKQEKNYTKANRWMPPAKLSEVIGTAIGSVMLLAQFLQRAIGLEQYFFLSGALLRIGGALNTVFGTLGRLQEPILFADSFYDLISRQPKLVDKPRAIKLLQENVPEIRFENVSFHYPGRSDLVFDDLNVTIRPGEHVAIVGENGAGKSTLIKLMLRFYRPTSGKIFIDGTDLQDIAIESWYEQLATLFQEFNEYPFSIKENIEIGRPSYAGDNERLAEAAAFAHVDSLVAGYKHGWDTVLDNSFEKGVEPSGGQWQRVALARVFYRNANVLILDEPTSAIDAKAEAEIFDAIFDKLVGRTALIISHRFSTVRRADRIIVIDQGKIVEEGSHEKLMANHGLYHEMFTKQAEGYKE